MEPALPRTPPYDGWRWAGTGRRKRHPHERPTVIDFDRLRNNLEKACGRVLDRYRAGTITRDRAAELLSAVIRRAACSATLLTKRQAPHEADGVLRIAHEVVMQARKQIGEKQPPGSVKNEGLDPDHLGAEIKEACEVVLRRARNGQVSKFEADEALGGILTGVMCVARAISRESSDLGGEGGMMEIARQVIEEARKKL